MLHPGPIQRRHGVGRLIGLLTLGLLLAAGLGVWAVVGRQQDEPTDQEVINAELHGDDTKPIRIYGQNISDWHEGNERVILMRGKVWVEQNLVRLCLNEGIAWISTEHRDGATIYHVDIYGETADLEQGKNGRSRASRAWLKMTTRGLLFKSFAGTIQHESASSDPLFARAVSSRGTGWAQAAASSTLAAVPGDVAAPSSSPTAVKPGSSTADLLLNGTAPRGTPSGNPAPMPDESTSSTPEIRLAAAQLIDPPGMQPPPAPPTSPAPPLGTVVPPPPPLGQPQPPPGGIPSTLPPAAPPSVWQSNMPMNVSPPVAESPGIPVLVVPGPPVPTQTSANTMQFPATPEIKDTKKPAPLRVVSIRSRTGAPWSATKRVQANGESVYIIPTGVIITVKDSATNKILIDIEADRLVYWSKDGNRDPVSGMQSPEGEKTNTMEFYLAGNVQIRNQQSAKESQTMRADEVYYDVSRNVAVAIKANVILQSTKAAYPIVFDAEEMLQIGPKRFEGIKAWAASPMFPSDPGIKMVFDKAVLEQTDTPKTTIFGMPFTFLKTGLVDQTPQKIISGDNAITYVEGVPIAYFPKFRTDAEKPLGPLEGLGVNYNTIFGFTLQTTWNVFDLIGIIPDAGKRWQLFADYMSARGPALGTTYRDEGKDLFGFLGLTNKYEINIKINGMYDVGADDIGGSRGTQEQLTPTLAESINHPDFRGRVLGQLDMQDLPNNFRFLGQFAIISDVNYLDQFYNQEWLNNPNQETFAYLKQQRDFWYWSIMVEDRIRPWITETNWLPKADGYVAGVDLFNMFTWNSKVGAGFAQLNTANTTPPVSTTDVNISTARVDWWQDISLPFSLGDARIVPYVVTDVTYYSQDLAGDEVARLYGGFGVKASVPLSKLFPDVQSDLLNLNGIFHKIVLSGNYYFAYTNVHYNQLPQLDRLNDDASDQALRDINPLQSQLNPSNAVMLTTSKLFDPQFYALQRLLDTQVDSLDSIDVFQIDLNQRWQTKRGVAGDEHVVDWMTLDLCASIFPQAQRDNFNQPVGFLSYDWLWNIGDRTSVFSNAWMDPISGGPHFFTMGAAYNRPDRTSFTLSYRQIDPLDSKAVIASLTYPLSAKYAITGSTMWDFGVNSQVNTIMLTRIGTDLRASLGFSYNSILNNFSVVVEIVPNLFPSRGGLGPAGGGMGTR